MRNDAANDLLGRVEECGQGIFRNLMHGDRRAESSECSECWQSLRQNCEELH